MIVAVTFTASNTDSSMTVAKLIALVMIASVLVAGVASKELRTTTRKNLPVLIFLAVLAVLVRYA